MKMAIFEILTCIFEQEKERKLITVTRYYFLIRKSQGCGF